MWQITEPIPFVDMTGMKLSRLIYLSDATRPMNDRELGALVEHCRINNETQGITGMLLHSGGHFMQVLEGDAMSISSLYTRICSDPRHENAARLQFKEVSQRLFPAWGMQLVSTNQSLTLDRERIDKVLLRLRLSKGDNQAAEAVALLEEFRLQFAA